MKKILASAAVLALATTNVIPVNVKAMDYDQLHNGYTENKESSKKENKYDIYPVPVSMKEKDGELNINDQVNLVMEDTVNQYTKEHIERVLSNNNISYSSSNTIVKDKTNILLGIDDDKGIVDAYFDEVTYDESISSKKEEGYVLDVDKDKNTIAIMGHENTGTSYGISTLNQIFDQSDKNIKEVLIEDSPETQFRGYIEGFYGEWSHENRKDLIKFCGENKMNTYIYGPKSDPYHAGKWREPYPQKELNQLKELVDTGKQYNVEVVWAIHVGGNIDLGSPDDLQKVKDKFEQLYNIGVRQFGVFFDDSHTDSTHLVEFMDALQHDYVDKKGDVKPLIMCPEQYNKGAADESYLKNLGKMDKRIQIMWTGDSVVSEINQDVVDYIVNLIDRPVYIWWNYPVNDLGRSHLLHMGPTEALAPNIKNMSGFVSNPMLQAQCSKVSLFSIADYSWNSSAYDSQTSWESSWERIITDDPEALEAFKIFCQNCASAPMSFSQTDESVYLIPYFEAFQAKVNAEEDYTKEAKVLVEKFKEIRNAVDVLKSYTGTNNITGEMNEWLDTMKDISSVGEYVFTEIQNLKPVSQTDDESISEMINFLNEAKAKLFDTTKHSKKCCQKRIYPFIESVLEDLEVAIYPKLDLDPITRGYGSAKVNYQPMLDGNMQTSTVLGSQIIDDYFGLDLGKKTNITDIHIAMSEDDGNGKKAYYKEGVLEYSNDKENWTSIATFDTPDIDAANLQIEARYIRYRATDEFIDASNGINQSNVIVKEMFINSKTDFESYTNVDACKDLEIKNDGGIVSFTEDMEVELQPNEYIGMSFRTAKTIFGIVNETGLKLEISDDGSEWNIVENLNAAVGTKYIRLINDTKQKQTMNTKDFSFKNGGVASVSEAVNSGGSIYSGDASKTVDGSRDTSLWFSNAGNSYIEYTFDTALPLDSMSIYCQKDILDKGHIDISEDGESWRTIATFANAGSENNLTFAGEKAKKVRLYMDKSGWVMVNEVTMNVKADMSIINGNDANLSKAMDGNILTSYDVQDSAGSFTFDNINRTNENTFVIVKNKGTTLHVDGLVDGKWKSFGDYSKVYNEIPYTEDVETFKVSWEEDSHLSIYEMKMKQERLSDISMLEKVLEQAQKINQDLYTESSVKNLNEAIKHAKSVINDENSLQEEVNKAIEGLQKAMDQLVYKDADYSKVDEIIAKIPSDLSKYTDASVKALNDAMNAVVRGLDIRHQKEVDKMAENLLNAVKGLQLKDEQPEIPGEKPEVPGDKPEIPSDKPETPNNGEDNKDEVKTGVQENTGIYMAGLLAAAVGAGYIVNRKKRKSDVK